MHFSDYLVLIGYFLAMAGLGLWAMRRNKGQEDFFLGGRGFGKLLQTFAAFGAGTGAQDPILIGRSTWTSGLTGIWSVLMWLFVTPFYWIIGVWYRRMRHVTLGDFFVERYQSTLMGAVYTLFAIAFCSMYLSPMFTGIAAVASSMIGVSGVTMFGQEVALQTILVPTIAIFVVIYGALGGLTAAYWTDLIQGICIIVLSVLLIPFGLLALVNKFGDPQTQGIMDGFTILHQRLPDSYFEIFGGPLAGEFPLHYIISLSTLGLVGIVVQPHFIVTGGGSAKTEFNARVGLVTGNFLKRLCTIGWALTGLIILALLADSVEIASQSKDRVWGVSTRELLGPLKLGLVGLMLACLVAALMSTADAFMLVCSALIVRNVYATYIDPNASERAYVNAGRIAGLVIPGLSATFALFLGDVLKQYTMALELPIFFAAPFWIGMYWRRATKLAAWGTVLFSLLAFFVAPIAMPHLMPELSSDERFAIATYRTTRTVTREATQVDVARREAWDAALAKIQEEPDEEKRAQLEQEIGKAPPQAVVGEEIEEVFVSGGAPIFWSGLEQVDAESEVTFETVDDSQEGNTRTVIEKRTGALKGTGNFNPDFVVYAWLGVELETVSPAMLKTLRLPPRLILPFLVLILLSYITPRVKKEPLDRFYVKMKTPVDPDPEVDKKEIEASYAQPDRFDDRKLFPNSQFEFSRPTTADVVGFVSSFVICFLMIGLLVWLMQLGASG